MKAYDLLITGGTVVTGNAMFQADLAVRNGKIAAILAPGEAVEAADRIDATGRWILPGLIDTHCHLRDPGKMEREDFTTGTAAAAAGGVTTIMEMPISVPTVNTAAVLSDRARDVQTRSLVDFALYGAAGTQNLDEIQAMADAGAVAFKTFLHAPHPGREHEFVGLWCVNEGELRDLMQEVSATGLRHCLHCESDAMINHYTEKLQAEGRKDGQAHCDSRPESVEAVSVATVLTLAEELDVAVQVCHLSSVQGAVLIAEAKDRGVDVTAETCPHYLFVTEEALTTHGSYAKCNPPLRSAASVERFWDFVADGTIDVIGTDHAPYLLAEKEPVHGDIWKAPAGFPGLEVMLPLMLTAVAEGRLQATDLVRLLSEKAAELFRLPGKGAIALGADADLVVVDPQAEWTFDMNQAKTKAKEIMHVYHGARFTGKVETTLVRGTKVYDGGEILVQPGFGQFVRPEPAGR